MERHVAALQVGHDLERVGRRTEHVGEPGRDIPVARLRVLEQRTAGQAIIEGAEV